MQVLTDRIEQLRKQIVSQQTPLGDELNAIEEDFQRMADFYRRGHSDPQMDSIYAELNKRLDKLARNHRYHGLTQGNPFYRKLIQTLGNDYVLDLEEMQTRLEDFSVDLSMLFLEEDSEQTRQKRAAIHRKHYDYRTQMFAKVLLINSLTKDNADTLLGIILSPNTDYVDASLLIVALMLSCMNVFDERKADVLYRVYNEAEKSAPLAQKAVVAFLLAISPLTDTVAESNISQPDISKYPLDPSLLAAIQKQLLYTTDAPRVERIMHDEIMPDVVKNSEFDFKNNRIIPRERDKIDDIINSNKEEEAIEKMEKTMRRMKELQDAGNDLFFTGFKYIKQHPFFNNVANWFVPFYFDHPSLPAFPNPGDRQIVLTLIDKTPFCESDKYSFILSMHNVISTIPENMKEMLRHGKAELSIVSGGDLARDEAYMRRIFMQDIFRFFKLCPWAKYLYNPFSSKGRSLIVKGYCADTRHPEEYDATAISVCKSVKQLGFLDELDIFLKSWQPQTVQGKVFCALCLLYQMNEESLAKALDLLLTVLREDEHNAHALFGLVRALFETEKGSLYFAPYRKNALDTLLAMHFKDEDDSVVLHGLLKAYLLAGDKEKAFSYAALIVSKVEQPHSFVNILLALRDIEGGNPAKAMPVLEQTKDAGKEIGRLMNFLDFNISQAQREIISLTP